MLIKHVTYYSWVIEIVRIFTPVVNIQKLVTTAVPPQPHDCDFQYPHPTPHKQS